MTDDERKQILQLLKSNGVPNCYYNEKGKEFILAKSRIGHLYLKENSVFIGLYGKDYYEKRKWAGTQLCDAIKRSTEFDGWNFKVPTTDRGGKSARWFTLKYRSSQPWFGWRDVVVGAAAKLYKILEAKKIFDASVNVEGVRNRATAQGNERGEETCYELVWDGWDSFYNYWDRFVAYWYDSGANPDDTFTRSLEHVFNLKDAKKKLNVKELPEPYYGNHESAKAVIVNLNPGASGKNKDAEIEGEDAEIERAKIIDEEGNFLVQSFADKCESKYSKYQEKWSMLRDSYEDRKNPYDVPGYDWWRKANRINFFQRFWGLKLADLFLLEACPYHSKNWKKGMERIEEHIVRKVITPAAVLANCKESCAVFVGDEFNGIISKIKGITTIGVWKRSREYSLYKLTLPDSLTRASKNNIAYLLVINGVQGMWLPAASKKENLEIERKISEIVPCRRSQIPI